MFGLFQSIQSVSTKELETKLTDNITLLDVRTPAEYRSGHISKAKNVPADKIASYSGNKDQPVYVICQSGMRSKRAAKALKSNGYKPINVRGGMSQWSGSVRGGK